VDICDDIHDKIYAVKISACNIGVSYNPASVVFSGCGRYFLSELYSDALDDLKLWDIGGRTVHIDDFIIRIDHPAELSDVRCLDIIRRKFGGRFREGHITYRY
jgi:hypothetical protein